MQGSFRESDNPHIWIKNPKSFLKMKRQLGNVARSRQMTLSQLCRSVLLKTLNEASHQEKNYSDDDGC